MSSKIKGDSTCNIEKEGRIGVRFMDKDSVKINLANGELERDNHLEGQVEEDKSQSNDCDFEWEIWCDFECVDQLRLAITDNGQDRALWKRVMRILWRG